MGKDEKAEGEAGQADQTERHDETMEGETTVKHEDAWWREVGDLIPCEKEIWMKEQYMKHYKYKGMACMVISLILEVIDARASHLEEVGISITQVSGG